MTTTWNTGFKSSGTTLSAGNLTATFSATASNVAATRSMTGKTYFEIATGSSLAGSEAIGLVNGQYSMSPPSLLGADTAKNSIGYLATGAVNIGNSLVTTIQTFTTSNTICIAVDPINQLIWFRVGSGTWNNSGTASPATGAGGISLANMAVSGSLGPLFPAAGGNAALEAATATFASGSFAQTPPTGFDTIDAIQIGAFVNGAVASLGASFTQYGPGAVAAVQKPSFRGIQEPVWINGAGAVSGNVKEGSIPISGKVVMILDTYGRLIGSARSDGSGNYSIPSLGRAQVFAVAFDPTNFQMGGFDRVMPV